ncbi:P-loop ATPase, Sll1717 family [Brachymonas sp.]|uniref:P-loop ATPase, Sll1717 family n=1 Tax=Brachymonas sp. TaxID=1936292 RepID=UPI0035B091A2
MRSSVWTRLTSESQGQRDQTDHMRGLVIPLLADDKLMQSIVRKRLERAARDAGQTKIDPYTIFFSDTTMTLPTSDERRSWDSFISKSARERPRDAIQLVKNMVDAAKQGNAPLIGSREAENAMKIYSSERVDDVVNEFSLDCKNIREIINTFADLDFESDFEKLRRHLLTVPSIASLQIRGAQLRPDVVDDAISILRLLHETGFLNPRVADTSKPRGFRHILFHEDSNFVKLANWNSMQGARWEVHPAFRTYLLGVKQAQLAKLPPTRPNGTSNA